MANILVVDDELGIRDLLFEILNDEGHAVEVAENAAQARAARQAARPDLVLLDPDTEWVEAIRASLPALPAARRAALATLTGANKESEAVYVVVERGQDDYVAAVAHAGGEPSRALVYVQQAFAEEGAAPRVPAADLAALTVMERDSKVTATQAKTILSELVANGGGDAAAIAAAKGFEALDTSAVEAMVDAAIASQPDAWAKYCAGEDKAAGALVGAVMKASAGKADGKVLTAVLQARRSGS